MEFATDLVLALGLLAIPAAPASAQATPDWRALHSSTVGGSTGAGHAVADPLGNVVVAFETAGSLGPSTELVKYSTGGQVLWARPPLSIYTSGMQLAANGDIVLCGNLGGGVGGMMVVRLNSAGALRWRRRIGGASANEMVLDALDQAVVVGRSDGDWLVQAFASDGTSPWVTHIDGPQHLGGNARCVAVDAVGDMLVGGDVRTSNGHTDAAVAKLSGAGQLQWLSAWSATDESESYSAIVSDGQGGAIAAGSVSFTWFLPPYESYINHQFTHFDAAGNVAWLHPNHGLGIYSIAGDVLVDDSGQVWAAIIMDPYAFSKPSVRIERIGSAGQTLSSFDYDGPTHAGAWPAGLQLDGAGRVVAGVTSGDLFGGADHQSVLLRMAATGTYAWTEVFSAPNAGLSTEAILRAPAQRVVLAGRALIGTATESDGLVMQVELDDPRRELGP